MGRYGDVKEAFENVGNAAGVQEGDPADRTTVDETGAGAWTTDKKVQH
jgi:hypothetical protein